MTCATPSVVPPDCCPGAHLRAILHSLDAPLRIGAKRDFHASFESLARIGMTEVEEVLRMITLHPAIAAFSSWPVDAEWLKGLEPVFIVDGAARALAESAWAATTQQMQAGGYSLNAFARYLFVHSPRESSLKRVRFSLELSLGDEEERRLPIRLIYLKEARATAAIHQCSADSIETYWMDYWRHRCPDRSAADATALGERWLHEYRGFARHIASAIKATRLTIVPFIGEAILFSERRSKAYGGCLAIYSVDDMCSSATVQLALHELAALVYRVIEEHGRVEEVGRGRQLSENLGFFGHDTQRLAEVARNILSTGWSGASEAASMFCASLESRSASYTRLLRAAQNDQNGADTLRAEMTRVSQRLRDFPAEASSYLQSLEDVFLSEFLPLFARICVGESLWENLAQSLFGSDPESKRKAFERVFPAGQRPSLSERLSGLAEQHVDIQFSGADVWVPSVLPGKANEYTVPLLVTGLRFIFSELLNNLAKHQWHEDRATAITASLTTQIIGTQVHINIASRPGSEVIKEFADPGKSLIGLSSLKMAIAACGGTTHEVTICTGTERGNRGKFPLPIYKDGTILTELCFPKDGFYHES